MCADKDDSNQILGKLRDISLYNEITPHQLQLLKIIIDKTLNSISVQNKQGAVLSKKTINNILNKIIEDLKSQNKKFHDMISKPENIRLVIEQTLLDNTNNY